MQCGLGISGHMDMVYDMFRLWEDPVTVNPSMSPLSE